MKPYRLGLVVGKFAPLHLGHEWLLRHAIAHCDEVLALSYSKPELAGCGVELRRRWLGEQFPAAIREVLDDADVMVRCVARGIGFRSMPPNSAPDEAHWAYLGWVLDALLERRPDAMFACEAYVERCAAALAHTFGRPVASIAPSAGRSVLPFSGTALRADVHGLRTWLSPAVYATFVERVVILGGESTGKTTLARHLAESLGTAWVAEYGRERWERQRGHLEESDLIDIARVQRHREREAARRADRYLVCDTDALTTLGYAQWTFGRIPQPLPALAQEVPHLAVLCAADFPFVQDGTRRSAEFRRCQQDWYREELARRQWPMLEVSGSVDQRIRTIRHHLCA